MKSGCNYLIMFLILFVTGIAYGYGPYKDDYLGSFMATNMRDMTSYIADLGYVKLDDCSVVENLDGHQFAINSSKVTSFETEYLNTSDSTYILLNNSELAQFKEIAIYCELKKESLLRIIGSIGTRKYRDFALDTIRNHIDGNNDFFEVEYHKKPDYFLLFLIKANVFNEIMQVPMCFTDSFAPMTLEEMRKKWMPKLRAFKDFAAFYRILVPIWEETIVSDDEYMPCE